MTHEEAGRCVQVIVWTNNSITADKQRTGPVNWLQLRAMSLEKVTPPKKHCSPFHSTDPLLGKQEASASKYSSEINFIYLCIYLFVYFWYEQ